MSTKKFPTRTSDPRPKRADWTFLTNHSHVLLCLVGTSDADDVRIRDIADRVGITERAVQRILGELEEAGYIARTRVGRRNVYTLDEDRLLRHPIEAHRTIRSLIELVRGDVKVRR